jgi:ATP-dependent Lon protease
MYTEKPLQIELMNLDVPLDFKVIAMKNIMRIYDGEDGDFGRGSLTEEQHKLKQWVDAFMKIPFGKYKSLPISLEDGKDKCHAFMSNAKQLLDDATYGLDEAKMQIIQYLGQMIANPSAVGNAIAIHGPPGTGKTSLIKDGISKILNRPFIFIALGGAKDSSYLEGHLSTYIGSTWGKIVQSIIDCGCMNPIIYFDELDKVSEMPNGQEIIGILTHLIDTTQNTHFCDKFFAEIHFDMSKCLFIFSYNDEKNVNYVLGDRMHKIKTTGYDIKQKITIGQNYLLPKLLEQVKFNSEDIVFTPEIIQYIAENFCENEKGVRNLKRSIEIICTKLNLFRLMNDNLFVNNGLNMQITFPVNITKQIVDKCIKQTGNQSYMSLYS